MSSYPKWLYHHARPAQVVPDEAAHKALGVGWVESPADAKAPIETLSVDLPPAAPVKPKKK
jgi:hypothetical protein